MSVTALFPYQGDQIAADAWQLTRLLCLSMGNGIASGFTVTRSSATAIAISSGVAIAALQTMPYAGDSLTSIPAAAAGKHRYDLVIYDTNDSTVKRLAGTETVPVAGRKTPATSYFLENYAPVVAFSTSLLQIPIAVLRITQNGLEDITIGNYCLHGIAPVQVGSAGLSGVCLLAGRSGGQTIEGDTASGGNLTLSSTHHATKGKIVLGSLSAYDQVNDRLGIGTTTPITGLTINKVGQTHNGTAANGALTVSDLVTTDAVVDIGFNATTSLGWIQSRNKTSALYYNFAINPNGGNVGIGTISPTTSLTVNKASQTLNGAAANGALAVSDLLNTDVVLDIGLMSGIGWIQTRNKSSITYYNTLVNPVGGNVGIGTTTPTAKLAVNGGVNIGGDADPGDDNLYVTGNCSALSFTDRTPAYVGDALSEIKKISHTSKQEIDHNTLPKFAQSKYYGEDGKEVTGRDLGAMISILTKAVQQLTARVEALEQ